MIALLIVGIFAGAFWLICRITDRKVPAEPERHPQPTHCTVINDQEPAA